MKIATKTFEELYFNDLIIEMRLTIKSLNIMLNEFVLLPKEKIKLYKSEIQDRMISNENDIKCLEKVKEKNEYQECDYMKINKDFYIIFNAFSDLCEELEELDC